MQSYEYFFEYARKKYILCSFLFNPREYHGLQGDYIGSTGAHYLVLMTHLSRTNHALISRKKYEIFLVFDGIIYIVYNTMDMEENSKKERGAGVKKRGALVSVPLIHPSRLADTIVAAEPRND